MSDHGDYDRDDRSSHERRGSPDDDKDSHGSHRCKFMDISIPMFVVVVFSI